MPLLCSAPVLSALLVGTSTADVAPPRLTAPKEDAVPAVSIGSRGFRVKSADGAWSIKVGGRLQADANVHFDEGPTLDPLINDGTELRRARFELQGTMGDDLSWAAELDMANNGTSIKDFWLGRRVGDGPAWFLGHQKQPYSLDIEMSSNDIPFVERGVDTFLVVPFVDRAVGVRVQDSFAKTFYACGLYGEGVTPNNTDDEGWGLAGRLVHAPVIEDDEVLHLGVRAAFRAPDDGSESVRMRDETTNMSNFRVVDTGTIVDVDGVTILGAEAAWATGPWSIGGEYNQLTVERGGGDLDFSSWHVQGTYTLTGESRAAAYRLDAGEFKRLRAGEDGVRPWELAARVASLDLNDAGLSGGEEDVLSVGLNWYYNDNLRFLWNVSHVLSTDGGTAETDEAEGLSLFTFRAQLNF